MYHEEPRSPTARDWNVAGIVARTAGIAIERHRATVRLRDILARQLAMLDALPACIALMDATGFLRSVNRGWQQPLREMGLTQPGWMPNGDFLSVCDSVIQCTDLTLSGKVRAVTLGDHAPLDQSASTKPPAGCAGYG